MYECCADETHICQFPTELLICLFKFLSANNLIICRQVCRRWKIVIDHVSSDDNVWQKYCERDFEALYKEAKMKSVSCLWFDIYRSLKLWGRLGDASEVREEFCQPLVRTDEIQDLWVLKDGVLSVLKQSSLVYYDLLTMKMTEREPVVGDFRQYVEYDNVTIILTIISLKIIKNPKQEKQQDSGNEEIQKEQKLICYNIKFFITVGRNVYFVNFDDTVFVCNIDEELVAIPLTHNYTDMVVSLSFYNDHLHMLSLDCNVYIYRDNAFVKLFNLESKKGNLFDCLWKYGFLKTLEWRIFYMLVSSLRIVLPEGPLKYICSMRIYGDVFFIGCKNGVVLIYYKPYVLGYLDFFHHTPVKRYRFSDQYDLPVFSLHPILKVEIVEIIGGHKIYVAMPKKVVVMTYVHNFEVTSTADVPDAQPEPLA